MKYDRPIYEIIQNIAEEFSRNGKTEFTRTDIIQRFTELYDDVNPDTVNPMIQGMTVNAEGGAPGALGKNILRRVRRGVYSLNR